MKKYLALIGLIILAVIISFYITQTLTVFPTTNTDLLNVSQNPIYISETSANNPFAGEPAVQAIYRAGIGNDVTGIVRQGDSDNEERSVSGVPASWENRSFTFSGRLLKLETEIDLDSTQTIPIYKPTVSLSYGITGTEDLCIANLRTGIFGSCTGVPTDSEYEQLYGLTKTQKNCASSSDVSSWKKAGTSCETVNFITYCKPKIDFICVKPRAQKKYDVEKFGSKRINFEIETRLTNHSNQSTSTAVLTQNQPSAWLDSGGERVAQVKWVGNISQSVLPLDVGDERPVNAQGNWKVVAASYATTIEQKASELLSYQFRSNSEQLYNSLLQESRNYTVALNSFENNLRTTVSGTSIAYRNGKFVTIETDVRENVNELRTVSPEIMLVAKADYLLIKRDIGDIQLECQGQKITGTVGESLNASFTLKNQNSFGISVFVSVEDNCSSYSSNIFVNPNSQQTKTINFSCPAQSTNPMTIYATTDAGTKTCQIQKQVLPRPETCGNNEINTGEECDGANLGGKTCIDLDFDKGDLKCTTACTLDKSECENIESKIEICDDGVDNDLDGKTDLNDEDCQGGIDWLLAGIVVVIITIIGSAIYYFWRVK